MIKYYFFISFFIGFVTHGTAQAQWADTLLRATQEFTELKAVVEQSKSGVLEEFTGISTGKTLSEKSEPKDTIRERRNNLQVSNFYSDQSALDSIGPINGTLASQASLTYLRNQAFLGLEFKVGFQGFLNAGKLDWTRSGIIIDFDHNAFLNGQKDKNHQFIQQWEEEFTQRQLVLDPNLLMAQTEVLFDQYLEMINNSDFQQYQQKLVSGLDSLNQVKGDYAARMQSKAEQQMDSILTNSEQLVLGHKDKLNSQTDSLKAKLQVDITTREKEVREKLQRIARFKRNYTMLLEKVKQHPHALRGRAQTIVDSFKIAAQNMAETNFTAQIQRHPKVTVLTKLLLRTKKLSIGNTHLDNDRFLSAGLPIKGINYTFAGNNYDVSLQHGKRIVSSHFTPRDGVPYHDLDNDYKFTQVGFKWSLGERSSYQFTSLFAKETSNTGGEVAQVFPRANRVFAFSGETALGKYFALNTNISASATRLTDWGAIAPGGNSIENQDFRNSLALKAGASFQAKNFKVSLLAFRTGVSFRSFANPYLPSDYEGAELSFNVGLLNNKLIADFQIALGAGTTPQTEQNQRFRGQGFLQYHFSKSSMLSLLVSPNIYRFSVTGQETFTESSIYQLTFRQGVKLNAKQCIATLGVTNLDQGWSWADSTQVNQSIILRGTLEAEASKSISFVLDSGYRLPNTQVEQSSGQEWYLAFSPIINTKIRLVASIRRDKYQFEVIPAWGGTLDLQIPLGQMGLLNLNVFYRPIRKLNDGRQTAHQFLSQQHLFTNF